MRRGSWLVGIVGLAVLLAGCDGPDSSENPYVEGRPHLEVAGEPRLGDPNATVTVAGFEAPGCAACRAFHLGTHSGSLSDLQETYFDTGRAVYHGLQWTIGSPYDQRAGVAVECAFREGGHQAYWAMLRYAYEHQGTDLQGLHEGLAEVGQEAEMDPAKARACLDGQETLHEVQQDILHGVEDLHAQGSPVFFVAADGVVQGPLVWSALPDAIEAAEPGGG